VEGYILPDMTLNITTASGITTVQLAHGKASALDVELVKALDHALRAAER